MSSVSEKLKKVPIFSTLSEETLEKLSKITEKVNLTEEDVIFESGDLADSLYVIESGQVRIEQHYRDGRKKTLAHLKEGSFFGEMAIVTESKRCAAAVVVEDTQLIVIDKSSFLDFLKLNPELCFEILQVMCDRLRHADLEISNMTFRNLPGRIVSKLLEMSEQFGQETPEGTQINLSITHHDLADMVGTNRESVSKYISKFKKEGAIKTKTKNFIIIDRRKLLSWS